MQTSTFQQHLGTYDQWKTHVARAILELRSWLQSEGQSGPQIHERIGRTLETLERDRLTVAFVAELSRGKTELINALFFADYGRRVLPSSAGRTTTMCPAELLWDQERREAYLRLLPIETRAQDASISELKRDTRQWVHYPLRVQDPEQMSSTLREIQLTKKVSAAEAARLGLSIFDPSPQGKQPGRAVEIPKWRYAIISFPHPLLEQGLVVLDTPGLNALGSEPELTLSRLPAAQAILFVLAAGTGVTPSDLELWQHHLKGFQSGRRRGIIVALNKIDVLWDELRETRETDPTIERQRSSTALALGIDEELVFPVSAQMALLAKIKDDGALLRKSALPPLEAHLSVKMLQTKHQALTAAINAHIGPLLERNRARISARISHTRAQLEELEQLRNKSNDVIGHLLEKTRQEQKQYLEGVRRFQASREELLDITRLGRQILDRESVASLIDSTYRDMVNSWTTRGMSAAMKGLFDELRRAVHTLTAESERIRGMVQLTYQQFEEDFGFSIAPPRIFAPAKFRVEVELLHRDAEAFRKSPGMALAQPGTVVKRVQEQLVSRALLLFDQLRIAFDAWNHEALQPLAERIGEHKDMMEKRLDNLQRIDRSKAALQGRIEDLQKQYVELAQRLTALRNIHNALLHDPFSDEQRNGKPHLVAGGA